MKFSLVAAFIGAVSASQWTFRPSDNAAYDQVLRCTVPETLLEQDYQHVMETMDVWHEREAQMDIYIQSVDQWSELHQMGMHCYVWINNVEELVQQERQERYGLWDFVAQDELVDPENGFFLDFRPFDDIVKKVKSLADAHPEIVRFVPSIGVTHENRSIPVLHITAPNGKQDKKVIWFNGGIHAREWISSHVATYLTQQLILGYERDPAVKALLEQVEFVVAPHINPDGYEYSRVRSRMWRKNRRQNSFNSFGVDLNRNFDMIWDTGRGSSGNPNSDTYRGPKVASEPETQALQNYIGALKNAVLGIDFHSYGQLIMRPYGWTYDKHPNEEMNKEMGDAARDAILATTGTRYTSQTSAGLYPVSGGFDDWMTKTGMIGFTIELRDTGRYGFVLPKEQILPTAQEIWEAFKVMAQFAVERLPARV